MVKNLSCVSHGSLKCFPHTFTTESHPSFSCLSLNLKHNVVFSVSEKNCYFIFQCLINYWKTQIVCLSMMANIEEQMKIYPFVTEQIFGYLDIRCLVKCREISKSWKLFIEKSRFSWVKMIKAIVQQRQPSVEIQSQWNRFLIIANNKMIRTVFRMLNWRGLEGMNRDFSPLFLLSKMEDSIELYKDICKTCKGDVFIHFCD